MNPGAWVTYIRLKIGAEIGFKNRTVTRAFVNDVFNCDEMRLRFCYIVNYVMVGS
jgi:hypothetical protein